MTYIIVLLVLMIALAGRYNVFAKVRMLDLFMSARQSHTIQKRFKQ